MIRFIIILKSFLKKYEKRFIISTCSYCAILVLISIKALLGMFTIDLELVSEKKD